MLGKHDIEEVLDVMTPEQRKDFEKFLASSELSEVVKPWQPWWFNASSSSLSVTSASSTATIEVIEEKKEERKKENDGDKEMTTEEKKEQEDKEEESEYEDEVGEEEQQEQPPIVYSVDEDTKAFLSSNSNSKKKKTISTTTIKPLPPLSSLTKQQPSPQLLHNVCNVLYAYAYTMRLYDGVWWESSNTIEKSRGPPKHQRLRQTSRTIECYMVINEISKGPS